MPFCSDNYEEALLEACEVHKRLPVRFIISQDELREFPLDVVNKLIIDTNNQLVEEDYKSKSSMFMFLLLESRIRDVLGLHVTFNSCNIEQDSYGLFCRRAILSTTVYSSEMLYTTKPSICISTSSAYPPNFIMEVDFKYIVSDKGEILDEY